MKKVTLPLLLITATLATTMFATSCKKDSGTTPTPVVTATLYDSLGGTVMVNDPTHVGVKIEQGRLTIRNIIDSTIFVIAADATLTIPGDNSSKFNTKFFSTLLAEVGAGNLSGFSELSANLTDFVAVASGAKHYTYSGMNMVEAHNPVKNSRMGAKANNASFTQFEIDLTAGAAKNGVPSSAQVFKSVATLVESLRAAVVQG